MNDNSDRIKLYVQALGVLCIIVSIGFVMWVVSRDSEVVGPRTMSVGVVFSIFLLGGGIFIMRSHQRMMMLCKQIDRVSMMIALFGIVVSLILGEFGARYYLAHYADERVFGRFATYGMIQKLPLRYSRHPYLSYAPTPAWSNRDGDRHNAYGFRGEDFSIIKPKGTYRIVTIGGSTTYGTNVVNYKESYPYLLAEELKKMGHANIEVLNAGVPFYDSWPILINFEFRVLPLEPDLVIYYEGDNEVKTRFVYPKENYATDNTGRVSPPPLPNTAWFDQIVLLRMLFEPFGVTADYSDLSRLHDAETLKYFEYLDQVKDKTYPSGIFRKISVDEILDMNLPEQSGRNLTAIATLAKKNGAQLLVSSFAYAPDVGVRTQAPAYIRAIKEHNMLIQSVATRENLWYYDLAARFPRGTVYWIRDGVHMTKEGAREQAKQYAAYIHQYILK